MLKDSADLDGLLAEPGFKFPFAPTYENRIRCAEMTPTQREIAETLIQGMSAHDIARKLGSTIRTVKCHLNALYRLYNIDTLRWSGQVRLTAILMLPPGSRLREQMERTR